MSSCYPQIFSICYSLLIIVTFFVKNKIKTIENKLYEWLLIGNFIGLLLDGGGIIIATLNAPMFVLNIMAKLIVVYLIVWIFTITIYIYAISHEVSYKSKEDNDEKWLKYTRFRFGCILVEVILSLVVFILPMSVIITSSHTIYSESISNKIVYVISPLLMCVWVYFLIKNNRHVKDKKFYPIYAYMLLGGVVALIQYLKPEILLIVPMETFITVLIFFTIENPDMKMIKMLDEAKMAAEKANRAKSDFLSNMSHEIRTPLNAIVGFSDCILEEDTLEAAQTDAKDIKLASENLLEIVNGILDISKIEADKMEIVETDYNPIETFENVAKLVLPRIAEKPIELKTKFASDVPYMLHGDGGKLRQVITNILTNSAKYTERGVINFEVNCVNADNVSTLVISVEDTGRGIKPEQIDKLFKKFERLDEDKNTTLEGTGLGLAITKRFVEMMGGKIVVQSKYGEGSKFTVYVNQNVVAMNKPEGLAENNTDDSKAKIDLSHAKVLVVDDNKVNIKVALKLLSNYGITADSLDSGVACLEHIKAGNKYDIILLDDMMPKMTGGETLAELKKLGNYNIPTIALTANAISGMREQYINMGFTDYLSKPIDKNELYRVLTTYIKDTSTISSNVVSSTPVKEVNPEVEQKKEYPDFSGLKALIVDDNKINIKITTRMIDDYKFDIDSCLSGIECLEKVKSTKYDVIFMDYMMPEMDGIETLHNLKKDPEFNTPVICLTADAVEGAREKFMNAGFDEYIAKPLDRTLLDEAIVKFVKKD